MKNSECTTLLTSSFVLRDITVLFINYIYNNINTSILDSLTDSLTLHFLYRNILSKCKSDRIILRLSSGGRAFTQHARHAWLWCVLLKGSAFFKNNLVSFLEVSFSGNAWIELLRPIYFLWGSKSNLLKYENVTLNNEIYKIIVPKCGDT